MPALNCYYTCQYSHAIINFLSEWINWGRNWNWPMLNIVEYWTNPIACDLYTHWKTFIVCRCTYLYSFDIWTLVEPAYNHVHSTLASCCILAVRCDVVRCGGSWTENDKFWYYFVYLLFNVHLYIRAHTNAHSLNRL